MQTSLRRFYTDVSVAAVEGGHAILLDGKRLKTPAQRDLLLPNAGLASAIAAEWRAQDKKIVPDTMPMMQLAATAIDHVPEQRATMVRRLTAYAGAELLCHRAAMPKALRLRQDEAWQPPLDWFKSRYDIVLPVTDGLQSHGLSPQLMTRLDTILDALDDWQLIGVQTAILAAGSLVLGLALYEGHLDAAAIFAAAELESSYQIDVWGDDPELEAKRTSIRRELENAARWFDLLQ